MILDFLTQSKEINNQSRQQKQKTDIVRYISKSKTACIIPDIAKQLKISIPTINKLITELLSAEILVELGKKDTGSGRKPILYALNKKTCYSVGVDIQLKGMRLMIINIQREVVRMKEIPDFVLENTQACLSNIIDDINIFLSSSMIEVSSVIGIGISLTGRVDVKRGSSISYFDFIQEPIRSYLSKHFKVPVLVDNDTRMIGLAEKVDGYLHEVQDAIVINVSRGLGASMISDGAIIKGANGFAGEFGHMQFGKKKRLCICGKSNCLGTDVSGYALELDFTYAIESGNVSLLKSDNGFFDYREIIRVSMQGDCLAIELIQKQGMHLGESLGNLLNLLNPSLIIIAGTYAVLGDVFIDAIRIGLSKTALLNPLEKCKVIASDLDGVQAAALGAAYLSFTRYDLL